MNLQDDKVYSVTGISESHAQVFQSVANATQCVIASRAVGRFATGLIAESYSSKGFHNKAKSCDWGPMAGFVLSDPRFAKAGDAPGEVASQRKALRQAIDANAIEVPLYISEDRRRWLMSQRLCTFIDRDLDSYLLEAVSRFGLKLKFRLKTARPEGANEMMWAVQYLHSDRMGLREAPGVENEGWVPVMAMRDPLCTVAAADYRAATTGDYDLFAIWAKKTDYKPDTADKRMVSHQQLARNIGAVGAGRVIRDMGEDPHLGNMTPRILETMNHLNNGFRRVGYTGGNMVHHSDEGGRPLVVDIDLPVFAVIPGKMAPYLLSNVGDVRQFVTAELDNQYAPVFNPGWMRQLTGGGR